MLKCCDGWLGGSGLFVFPRNCWSLGHLPPKRSVRRETPFRSDWIAPAHVRGFCRPHVDFFSSLSLRRSFLCFGPPLVYQLSAEGCMYRWYSAHIPFLSFDMRLDSFTALFALSNALLGASAGPLAAKRQGELASIAMQSQLFTRHQTDESASVTATSSASSSADTIATSTSSQNEEGIVVGTMSDGKPTTYLVKNPNATPTGDSSATATGPSATYTYSRTGLPAPLSTSFPRCSQADAAPFCLPNNMSTLYVDKTYYATWNPDYFPLNSTVTVKVQWANDTDIETWSSDETPNSWGFVPVDTKKDWLQGKPHTLRNYLVIQTLNDCRVYCVQLDLHRNQLCQGRPKAELKSL